MVRKYRPSETADALERAADLLEEKGWCRNAFHDDQDRHCLLGAVSAVSPRRFMDVDQALFKQFEHDYGLRNMTEWNDSQRDKRKITRLLRRTARNIRNRKGPFAR